MTTVYNYKKIQEMRNSLKEELISTGVVGYSVEHDKLVEMRLHTAIMAGLLNNDINEEVKVRPKDK